MKEIKLKNKLLQNELVLSTFHWGFKIYKDEGKDKEIWIAETKCGKLWIMLNEKGNKIFSCVADITRKEINEITDFFGMERISKLKGIKYEERQGA